MHPNKTKTEAFGGPWALVRNEEVDLEKARIMLDASRQNNKNRRLLVDPGCWVDIEEVGLEKTRIT
jgi:hypothetical protein